MVFLSILAISLSLVDSKDWTTTDQNLVQSPISIHVRDSWTVFQVSAVSGRSGNFTAAGSIVLKPLPSHEPRKVHSSSDKVTDFCKVACSDPQFAHGPVLYVLKDGHLYFSKVTSGHWSAPLPVAGVNNVIAYRISPDSQQVAYTQAEMGNFSTTEPRLITTDVIVNVITGTPQPTRNILCVADLSGSSAPRCFHELDGSVGMEGWRISCWPYDSQFEWAPDSKTIAVTHTAGRLANGWESVRVATVDVTATKPDMNQVGGAIAFQPMYSDTGALAFTQADSSAPTGYTWAQTWKICVQARQGSPVVCDEKGTADAMPTLVGWTKDGVLFMEQSKTEVALYLMTVVAGKPGAWRKVSGTPCESRDCGVLGGGFRATSRVTVWSEGDSAMLGFSWENLHTAPQAFVARLRGSTVTSVRQISSLNAFAAHQQWPAVSVRTWHSDDGSAVEGLFIHAVNHSSTKPPPLIVFTHCGPAMASLSTFIGAGSVCARFPLAIWAQRGYNVLLPNYRGSTGYGRAFRRGDLDGWGAGDYNDVMSGFVSMAKDGLASLTNCAHVGWSYGGYMTALALTRAKETHGIALKAVVGGGCLADLISQVGTTDISKIYQSSNSGQYYWDDARVQATFMERSAMYHVANASAPTLLFHGQHDPRMPLSQPFQLHYALQALKVKSRFLVFPGAGHIPGDPNQIARMWDESLEWVAEHMPTQLQ